jgi:hypothetical protein
MRAIFAPMSVNDYCRSLNEGDIIVNEDYQRKKGLWTGLAKSFFIESILLEYPIPKIYLYANVDLKTRKTIKEIVDGQQRSDALLQFYNGRTRLSIKLETEELRGKKYAQLSGEYQSTFLTYQLPIDQFSGVPDSEVRESFRRMNASNVPLNAEEQRNARFQGPFKWFIQHLGKKYNEALYTLGVFSKRDLVRMADTRMYADIAYVLVRGIHTTKSEELDAIYRHFNSEFPQEDEFEQRIGAGIDCYLDAADLHVGPLLKPHLVQTFVSLFISQSFGNFLDTQADELAAHVLDRVRENNHPLDDLIAALVDSEEYPELATFASACKTGTNVAEARAIRYVYFRQALRDQ